MKRSGKQKKEWSPNSYIKSHLRKIWRWSPARRECLSAKQCFKCRNRTDKLFADHIDPVVDPKVGFVNWEVYIHRMFTGKLQPLCETCHAAKSKEESATRRQTRKALKEKQA